MPAAREWDASTYDRVADPQAGWGATVVGRLEVADGALLLDAGCGTGRVTELLLERVPRGRVLALDASRRMLDQARLRLAHHGDRVRFVHADLRRPLAGLPRVDAVVSTATFHWIADHQALFANLAGVLRPGGTLLAQCGGQGNIASVVAVLRQVGDGWPGPWQYATPQDTVRRLHAAGFAEATAWLEPAPVSFDDDGRFREFLATVILGAHLDRLPAAERPGFVAAVAERLPGRTLDYVRLNLVARLPAAGRDRAAGR
jgi:trans-aconitate 2-methyltransferase